MFLSPVEFGLPAFSVPSRDPHNHNAYASHHPYEPTPLQIPSQRHAPDHSPSTYLPSATSILSSTTFPFPPSSHSRSLSPGDHTGWTDHSSPLSLSPLDGAPNSSSDLTFDNHISQISFPMNHHPSGSSLRLLSPARRRDDPRRNGQASPKPRSSEHAPEPPRVKLGPNGLAEDQPPTAQGKMRTRVYVACLQWFVMSMWSHPSAALTDVP
jgi:hypothetical protein